MAAGLGFKTFTTGEVLTAADTNGYLMQGINVFASTAARNSAITSPQEGQFAFTKDTNSLWYYDGAAWVASGATGDIEGVTAGVGISGGGTSGTVTVTNSMATAIDAKGDLIGGTGADAFSRLAVGANDTVLTADSAQATGLKWATPASGSMTLLSTTAITTAASITLSSISGSYQSLILNVDGAYENTSGIFLQFNSNASSIYYSLGMRSSAGNYVESTQASSSICIATSLRFPAGSGSGSINVYMPMYASATTPKLLTAIAATGNGAEQRTGQWADITAVTSLKITMGTPTAQGTMYLYGVK